MCYRLARLGLALFISSLAFIMSLWWMDQSTRVMARPLLTSRTYPGAAPCNTTLQACIDGSSNGDVINILAGTYSTSITLNKAVSLIGANSATTILRALTNQRVLTVTGAGINNSTIISGLMFTAGNADTGSFTCPQDCGGGILLTGNAQPLIQNVVISNNVAFEGGGLYADTGIRLTLNNVLVISNTASSFGGGVTALGPAILNGGLFQNNLSNSDGGGLDAESMLSLTGTQFMSNTAIGSGGAIFVFGAATLSGGSFEANRSNNFGGGLDAGSTLSLSGARFLNNTADFGGGAVYLANNAQMVNVLFARNASSSSNGMALLFNTPGNVQLLHSTIASPLPFAPLPNWERGWG